MASKRYNDLMHMQKCARFQLTKKQKDAAKKVKAAVRARELKKHHDKSVSCVDKVTYAVVLNSIASERPDAESKTTQQNRIKHGHKKPISVPPIHGCERV